MVAPDLHLVPTGLTLSEAQVVACLDAFDTDEGQGRLRVPLMAPDGGDLVIRQGALTARTAERFHRLSGVLLDQIIRGRTDSGAVGNWTYKLLDPALIGVRGGILFFRKNESDRIVVLERQPGVEIETITAHVGRLGQFAGAQMSQEIVRNRRHCIPTQVSYLVGYWGAGLRGLKTLLGLGPKVPMEVVGKSLFHYLGIRETYEDAPPVYFYGERPLLIGTFDETSRTGIRGGHQVVIEMTEEKPPRIVTVVIPRGRSRKSLAGWEKALWDNTLRWVGIRSV